MSIAAIRRQSFALSNPARRYHSLMTLVVAGLLAVGVSGLICDGLGRLYGKNIIAGDSQSAHLTPARCADLREYHPEAATCSQAELAHHYDEVVTYREVMLPAGIVLALLYWLVRRNFLRDAPEPPDVRRLRLRIGAAAFGLAAIGLVGMAALGGGTAGLGRNLSDGLMAAAVALGFAITFYVWPRLRQFSVRPTP